MYREIYFSYRPGGGAAGTRPGEIDAPQQPWQQFSATLVLCIPLTLRVEPAVVFPPTAPKLCAYKLRLFKYSQVHI